MNVTVLPFAIDAAEVVSAMVVGVAVTTLSEMFGEVVVRKIA